MVGERRGRDLSGGVAALSAAAREPLAWRVEEAELNALPSVRQLLAGGWALRFSEGGPRRGANSASPLRNDCDGDEAFIDQAAALYRRRGSTPLFRIPSPVHREWFRS